MSTPYPTSPRAHEAAGEQPREHQNDVFKHWRIFKNDSFGLMHNGHQDILAMFPNREAADFAPRQWTEALSAAGWEVATLGEPPGPVDMGVAHFCFEGDDEPDGFIAGMEECDDPECWRTYKDQGITALLDYVPDVPWSLGNDEDEA